MFLVKKNFIVIVIVIHTLSMPSGQCLDCFVCHGKKSKDCSDPFEANLNSTVDCQRIRDVGVGLLATSNILGSGPSSYVPLSQPPHVCFKLNMDNFLVRGCGKPNVCENYTETECSTCDADGCNKTSTNSRNNAIIIHSAVILYTLYSSHFNHV